MKIFRHLIAVGMVALALLTLAPPAQAQQFDPPTKEQLAFENRISGLSKRGWLLLLEKKPAEALRYFQEAHSLSRIDNGHVGGMGLALWDLGRKEEAIQEWKTMRETAGFILFAQDRRRPEPRLFAMKLLEAGFSEEAKQVYYSRLPSGAGYSGGPVRMTVVFDEDDSPEADVWVLTPRRLEAAMLMQEYFRYLGVSGGEDGARLLERIRELAPDWALPVFYLGFHHPKDRQPHFSAGIAMERNPLRKAEMKLAAKTDFWDGEDDNPEGWIPTSKIIQELESVKRAREAIRNSTFWRH